MQSNNIGHRYKFKEASPWFNTLYCYISGQVDLKGHSKKKKKLHNKKKHSSSSSSSSSTSSNSWLPLPEFDCASLSADSTWWLRRWPLELVEWPQHNSDREDVLINYPASKCNSVPQAITLLPMDESVMHRWNGGPWDLEGGSGYSESGADSFLVGYWSMRYFGLLE